MSNKDHAHGWLLALKCKQMIWCRSLVRILLHNNTTRFGDRIFAGKKILMPISLVETSHNNHHQELQREIRTLDFYIVFCSDWYILIDLDAHFNILSPFGIAAQLWIDSTSEDDLILITQIMTFIPSIIAHNHLYRWDWVSREKTN
jgi:hypothetical protein